MNERIGQRETIVYGGAFNPPTRAHQAILQACVDRAAHTGGDVWLLPSGERADKSIGVPIEHRLRMCRALAEDVVAETVSIRIQDRELRGVCQTETYDTVREFECEYPERSFRWVFGADSLASMKEWHGGEWMYENLDMLIVERRGNVTPRLGARAILLDVETSDVSSTLVRTILSQGGDVASLVGNNVADTVRDLQTIYRASPVV